MCICMRHVMRGSTKILYHVMWQLFLSPFFCLIFVNLNSGNVFLCTFLFLFGMACFYFCNPPFTCFAITLLKGCNHTETWFAINYILACKLSFSFAIAAHQSLQTHCKRMFAITSIFGLGCNLASISQCRVTELFFYQFFAIVITLL
jgi:hypothetical protein